MKKIRIKEEELIALIEKVVNEQATGIAFGSGFEQNMGVSKPTDKYEELNLETASEEEEIPEEVAFFASISMHLHFPTLPRLRD